MLMKHIHGHPPDIREMGQGARVPDPIADVVMRALSKRPGKRFADANAFREALVNAAHASSIDKMQARISYPGGELTPAFSNVSGYSAPLPSIAGLSTSRRPHWMILVTAFLLGVGLVWGANEWAHHQQKHEAEDEFQALLVQAMHAAQQGQYATPEHENVLDLTNLLLERQPEHPVAMRLRREALASLHEQATRARQDRDFEQAKLLYESILNSIPGDETAERRA